MKTPTAHNATMGSPPIWIRWIVASLIACLAGLPVSAFAVDLTGTSRSYLMSRETADGTKLLPGYEYLDFAITDLGSDTLSAHVGGWAGYDFKEKTGDNDLQYGYLSFKSKTANSMVNLGRVMVSEGVTNERLDGIYARTDLMYNFGIAAYGGNPVELGNPVNPAPGTSGSNSIYGGRLTHQMPGLYRIGVSYLKEERLGSDYRKEEAVDLWLHPMNFVDLIGRSNYNAITKEWSENTYNLVLGPFAKLLFTTEASWINYKDYFYGATMSAFTFAPGILDTNEKVRRLGENVAWTITDKVSIGVDYTAFDYEIAGSAKSYGAVLRYGDGHGGAGLSLRKMDGDSSRLKYNEYRIYANKKIDKIDVAVDLLDVKYDEAINGVTNAYSASIALGYELMHNLLIGADAEYQKNPDFDKDIRVFAKLVYNFDFGTKAKSAGGHGAGHSAAPSEGKPVEPAAAAPTPPEPAVAAPAAAKTAPEPAAAAPAGAGTAEQGGAKEVKP